MSYVSHFVTMGSVVLVSVPVVCPVVCPVVSVSCVSPTTLHTLHTTLRPTSHPSLAYPLSIFSSHETIRQVHSYVYDGTRERRATPIPSGLNHRISTASSNHCKRNGAGPGDLMRRPQYHHTRPAPPRPRTNPPPPQTPHVPPPAHHHPTGPESPIAIAAP